MYVQVKRFTNGPWDSPRVPTPTSTTALPHKLRAQLSLTWRDCNMSKHSRITDVTPDFMMLGSKIPITVRGEVDKEIEDGTFSINTQSIWMKGLLDI